MDARSRRRARPGRAGRASASSGPMWCWWSGCGSAVARINPDLPPEAVQRVCELALTITSPSRDRGSPGFHELLLSGVPVSYRRRRRDRAARARAARGLRRSGEQRVPRRQPVHDHRRREEPPAGHPAVRQRAAARADRAEGARATRTPREAAVNQVAPLHRHDPGRSTATSRSSASSDLITARVGTITTPAEHFAEWKTMGRTTTSGAVAARGDDRRRVRARRASSTCPRLRALRDRRRADVEGDGQVPPGRRRQRGGRVGRAAMGGDERGGVVWHTQGAGKSYTMVFFVSKLRRDPRFGNPTIVAVTDRTDLDNQLAEHVHRHAPRAACAQAEEITGGPESLHELLNVPAGGIVFTTIQKFAPLAGRGDAGALGARERHRDGRRGAPLAVREVRREHHARAAERDPDRLHRHAGREAPIARPGWCSATTSRSTGCARRRRTAPPSRSTTSRGRSRSRSRTPSSSPTSRRCSRTRRRKPQQARDELGEAGEGRRRAATACERLADDVAEHFTARCEALAGKAMVVAYSRRIARRADRASAGALRRETRSTASSPLRRPTRRRSRASGAPSPSCTQLAKRLQGSRRTRCASSSSRTCG